MRGSSFAGRILTLLVLAALPAGLANLLAPRQIPWVQEWSNKVVQEAEAAGLRVVDVRDARRLVEAGTHLVFDARPVADYDAGHLPTAMPMPSESMEADFAQYQALLAPDQAIMVYCSGRDCDESLLLGEFFVQQGLTNVVLFAGGYADWTAAGEEVER